jgi:hypothetical protein
MKTTDLKAISNVVKDYRLVSDRVEKLIEMGHTVKECAMGSGGVLQVKEMKGETRIQVGYGKGKHNYAYAVIIKK